jgi:hypothetical protein
LYVHTDNSPVVWLSLLNKIETKDQVTDRPFLCTSSSPVVFHESAGGSLRLEVDDFRPECHVRLGGLTPKSSWDVKSAGRSERLTVDALGFINIKLNGRCEADVIPAP